MRAVLTLSCAAAAAATFIPASSPYILYSGRTQVNADGSRSFDWGGVAMSIRLSQVSYVNGRFEVPAGEMSKVKTFVDQEEASLVLLAPNTTSVPLVYLGRNYPGPTPQGGPHNITVWHASQPLNIYAGQPEAPITFLGFDTDGVPLPSSPLPRKLEFIGDSITAGSGSLGAPPAVACHGDELTSDHSMTFGRFMCSNLQANCSFVAWAGKGLMRNCCDPAGAPTETMPSYWRQTLGGGNYSSDWVFGRIVPDAVVVALGTNDYHANTVNPVPGFEADFTAAYVSYVANITAAYAPYRPWDPSPGGRALPIFALVGPITDVYLNGVTDALLALNGQGYNVTLIDTMGAATDGCDSHPGPVGHRDMAAKAQAVVQRVMGW